MPATRIAALALIAATTAGVTACSSGTSGTPPATSPSLAPLSLPALPSASAPASTSSGAARVVALPDACALLTRTEAESVAGVKLNAGDDTKARDPMSDTASCMYDAPVTGSSGSVQIFVQMGPEYALGVDKAIHHKFRSVPGIADGALEERNNIFFHSGAVWVQLVSAYGAKSSALEAAAKTIAARLPKS